MSKADKIIIAEPQVKDVCAECNNGVLSELDAYICKLWDSYFYRIVERGEEIRFDFNYNLLSRGLLKMSYNSARIHNSDIEHLAKCKGYILGQAPQPDHVMTHLQLSYPVDFTSSDLRTVRKLGLELTRHEPRLNRVGHMGYMTRSGIRRIIRAVHIQSYIFLIHLFPDKVSPSERLSNLNDFKLTLPYTERVDEGASPCLVKCEGMDSKESLYSHYGLKGIPRL